MDIRPAIRKLEMAFFRSGLTRLFAELMSRKARHLYAPIVTDAGPLPPGSRIADIGCGHATFLRMYLAANIEVEGLGIDQSERLLRFARRKCAVDGLRAEFVLGDVHDVPLPAEAFDAAVSVSSIYCWRDPVHVLNRLHAALKPGGRLLVYDELPARTPRELWDALFVQKIYGVGIPAWTEAELRDFVARSRFGGGEFSVDRLIIRIEMRKK